jgi:hypothetical protein
LKDMGARLLRIVRRCTLAILCVAGLSSSPRLRVLCTLGGDPI